MVTIITNSHEHPAPPANIDLQDVSVLYGSKPALDHITVSIPVGHQVAVVGPNGAGKSTLFKLLVGLVKPTLGEVQIHTQPVGCELGCAAYVPQREEVDLRFPITVQEVIMMGRYMNYGPLKKPSKNDHEAVHSAMEQLNIQNLAKSSLNEISGGQLQRVFLARAVAQEPHILLMDEPFNGVDVSTQEATFQILAGLRAKNVTVMVSTHDLNMAMSKFETILLLNHKLVAFGSPQAVMTKNNLSEAFGSQIFLMGETAMVDHCCPTDELTEEIR
jgi:manganese/iron transport system ATP-binding protein